MNITLRISNTLLLAGILWTLIQIRTHMPPTVGEIAYATPEQKTELILREPFGISGEH